MKYKCNDCGYIFDEPYLYEEPDVGYAALWCPSCHSDDIIEVGECKICEEFYPIHDLTIDGYCPDCVKRTARKLDLFLNKCEPEELQIFKEQFGIEPICY
jgi:Zn finger protein HypA/HybF involved in hydrogenase expression